MLYSLFYNQGTWFLLLLTDPGQPENMKLSIAYEIFSHLVLELMRVKLLHAVVNKRKHRGAWSESEPGNEVLSWLEPSNMY